MDVLSKLAGALGLGKKAFSLARFQDPLGNFTISCPSDWHVDSDVAVVDGAYTISFASPDGRGAFNIHVDAGLKKGFDFSAYAKSELESPSSGVYTAVKKGKFRDMPAYNREYCYRSSGQDYFAGGTMFFTGRAVFSISWNAPESERKTMEPAFSRMLESLILLPGVTFRSGKF
ncbi:MAG: hypothetical protein PHV13_05065 [Candidatus ainarchaeum sp.]|nr:hypothetical protein [Candidatus ainarchaeum sp.]